MAFLLLHNRDCEWTCRNTPLIRYLALYVVLSNVFYSPVTSMFQLVHRPSWRPTRTARYQFHPWNSVVNFDDVGHLVDGASQ